MCPGDIERERERENVSEGALNLGNHLNIYIHQDIDYILQCNTMYTVCLLA